MNTVDFQRDAYTAQMVHGIIEKSDSQLFVIDISGHYLYFNPAHHQLLRFCLGRDLYSSLKPGDALPKEFLKPTVLDAIQAARIGKSTRLTEEIGNKQPGMVWLEMEVGPVYVQGSILTGISFLCRDISQRVAKEKDLLAAKEAALSDAKAKTAFLSSMSHEIRTPMHAIIGLTELLLQKQQEENTLENLKAIRFSANNLLTIINDILDFSKIEAGRFSFDIHVFDIFQVLDEINKGIRMSAQQKNLGYEVQLNGSIPTHLKGDSVRLSQILMNLLGNSIKFTQTGKIRLSVDVLHDTETEIVLEFTVADTGIGIPRDQLPHIFQTFNQVNNQQRFKIQGTGLGLSITRKLVEMQEGQIKVESEVGKGSVFTFSLPFLKAGQSDWMKSESEENQDPLFKDFKVLLVEDNKINQLLAKQMLTAWGVEVEVAGDGFEAIARLRRHSFDLILLDLQLPEMDGFEVARFVRKSTKSPSNSVPIVALSADVFDETRMLTEEAGMDDYITKPYQQKDILRVLKKFTTGEVEPLVKSEENTVGKTFKSIDIQFVKDKFGKDPETLQYILEIFRDEVGPQLQAVHSLLQKNDIQNSEKPVHKLVSTFFAMGMPETASILSSMEKMLKQGEEAAMVLIRLEEVMGHYQGALMQTGPLLESLTKDPLEAQMKPNNK